jgi:hypothetical protein
LRRADGIAAGCAFEMSDHMRLAFPGIMYILIGFFSILFG